MSHNGKKIHNALENYDQGKSGFETVEKED
jgi:hypothetical protein